MERYNVLGNQASSIGKEGGCMTDFSDGTGGNAGLCFIELAESGRIKDFNLGGENGRFAGISYVGPRIIHREGRR